jgi:hypothetical protein
MLDVPTATGSGIGQLIKMKWSNAQKQINGVNCLFA